ncbi:MAG TPA: cytidylate kinase family protein [Bryobacterales bacterium]|nr:cytidylate kinase family protein [Bryobacterales bacterium]
MAILTVSAQPGLQADEIARQAAARLDFELITQARVESLYESEFNGAGGIPARGYADVVTSMLARLAAERHLVCSGWGGEYLFRNFPGALRVRIVAPAAVRAGVLMVAQGLEQAAAVAALRRLEREQGSWLRDRFRKIRISGVHFDLAFNLERWDASALAEAVVAAARALGIEQAGLLSPIAERQVQFEARLRLARLGVPAPGAVALPSRPFAHPSEEIFANLLDFYRIPWEYEPRSFPIAWDEQGRVVESFTPDFYLPEFDLYVELTTMKQSHVTKKNRKLKRMRELYADVNVQIFYQKDFENLIFKYGLEKTAEMLKE